MPMLLSSVTGCFADSLPRSRAYFSGTKNEKIELANDGNMPSATNAVYVGEDNINQAGFNTANLFGAAAGYAAYDEVLSGSDAQAIASLFIV